MGCDIHVYAEKKVDGSWYSINPLKYWSWEVGKPESKRELHSLYDGRNYELFGWLAQVRTKQENGFVPNGFPVDASEEVQDMRDEYGEDGHSDSHLTLAQLESKFGGTVKVMGMMRKDQWHNLSESLRMGKPNWDLLYPHCQWASEGDYVDFEIDVPMSFIFDYFYEKVIRFLREYSGGDNKEDVRIVFWFDN